MDYREKYLKYKNKYINLQKYYLQLMRGGNVPTPDDKLINCYIASSHNTYLVGNQLTGATDINCYLNFIKKYGGGCVEMDIVKMEQNKDKEDVYIKHSGTFSSGLFLRDILTGIKNIINNPKQKMSGPVILSFDNKDIKSFENHQKIWKIFEETLGDILYDKFDDNNLFIKDIKGKVLIKWPEDHTCKCTETQCAMCEGKHLFKPIAIKTTHWTHLTHGSTNSSNHTYSYSHKSSDKKEKDIEEEKKEEEEIKKGEKPEYNKKITTEYFIRIFPPGGNFLSGNYPFMKYIQDGVQLVALNIQTQDFHTMFQMEFFRNGCLRKKPDWIIKLKNPPKKYYNVTIPGASDIQIYKDDSDHKINIKTPGDNFTIEVNDGLELIFIKLNYNKIHYKGAITLNEKTNTLYNIPKYATNTCNWFTENELNKFNPISFESTFNENKITKENKITMNIKK